MSCSDLKRFPDMIQAHFVILHRAYNVGTLHEPGEGIKIVKVAWHPLSEYGSHLVVLTEDGVLK